MNFQENRKSNYMNREAHTPQRSATQNSKFKIQNYLTLRLALDINNLLSQDYDVILNYPMPKRNYKCTISITY